MCRGGASEIVSRAMRASAWALAVLIASSCSGTGGPGASSPLDARARWTGQVSYEARHATPQGASEEVEARPARFVDLALVDAAGAIVAEGRADAEGRFELEGPLASARLRVFARVRVRGHDAAISQDALGRETHFFDLALSDPAQPISVTATDQDGHAGALHLVDTMLRGLDAVQAWTGQTLPPLFAYWVRGGTREWSYYRGERPAGSGRFALELMGGDPGQQSVSDTDEHDEAIVLHEVGHFVMDRLTRDSSTGGTHPRGVRIDPGLAWEEGRATWFALAVLRDPLYRDTIGLAPWGRLRVDENLERAENPLPGLGSETSVSAILWDLSDGTAELPDADDDGLALGPAAVLSAMMELARGEDEFVSLPSFLRHVVSRGLVASDALASMLQRTGEPEDLLPQGDAPSWPRRLEVGQTASDKIDGFTQPAPGGGPNLPGTGFDAIHTYLVHVVEPGMLVVRLDIVGSGRVRDHEDLDLELLDLRADHLESSRTESATESVAHLVTPGYYVVRVRDGGSGNRADYHVHAEMERL